MPHRMFRPQPGPDTGAPTAAGPRRWGVRQWPAAAARRWAVGPAPAAGRRQARRRYSAAAVARQLWERPHLPARRWFGSVGLRSRTHRHRNAAQAEPYRRKRDPPQGNVRWQPTHRPRSNPWEPIHPWSAARSIRERVRRRHRIRPGPGRTRSNDRCSYSVLGSIPSSSRKPGGKIQSVRLVSNQLRLGKRSTSAPMPACRAASSPGA